jgi:hypothetical protein
VFTSNSLGFIFVCFVLPNLRFISVGENERGEREREKLERVGIIPI